MIQLSGKVDGGFPFQAITNGSVCSVGVVGTFVRASTEGWAWLVSISNPTELPHQYVGAAFFKWPNLARQWQAKQVEGHAGGIETNQTGFKVPFNFVVPPGSTSQLSGSFGLVGDVDFDGDVDAADLAVALSKAFSAEELGKLLGNWGASA